MIPTLRAVSVALCLALAGAAGAAATLTAQPVKNRVTLPNGRKIFVSGMNLAWINFGADVGDAVLDTNKFKSAVQNVRDSGGNAMRVWLSTNGANDPKFDATTGLVTGLGSKTIYNVKAMLDIAKRNGVVLVLDLLTHNLMAASEVGSWNSMSIANNKMLMQTDAGITAYVNNAVIPLVKAIGNDSAVLCWEVFNEPEGMVAGAAWGLEPGITMPDVQKVVNRVAGAIHRTVPGILVSNGAVTMESTSDVAGVNSYSDSALKAVGGDADGVLDFYMAHYYGWNGVAFSPFTKTAAYWNLDKPLVIAEFPAGSWSPQISSKNKDAASIDTLYSHLYNTGYAGALSWNYYGDGTDIWLGKFETVAPVMNALFKAHTADIKILDVTRVKQTGNGVLDVHIDNDKSTVYPALKLVIAKDFSKNTAFAFDLLVPKSVTGGIKLTPVVQTTSAWNWNASGVYCTPKADSTWMVCKAPISGFTTSAEMNSVQSIMFQFIANPTFHGDVWLDNIRIDNDTLWNFNNGETVFGPDTYDTAQAARLTGLDVKFVGSVTGIQARQVASASPLSLGLHRTATGLTWSLPSAAQQPVDVRISDLEGRKVAAFHIAAGSRTGSFKTTLPTGSLAVSVRSNGLTESRLLVP